MKKEIMFIIGTCSLTISIILSRLSLDLPIINFFEGMFIGISLVMNFGFLLKYRLEKEDSGKKYSEKKAKEGY